MTVHHRRKTKHSTKVLKKKVPKPPVVHHAKLAKRGHPHKLHKITLHEAHAANTILRF